MRVFTSTLCLSSCCLEQLSVSYYSGLSCVMLESGMKKMLMSMHEYWLMKVKWLQICSLHSSLGMFRLGQWALMRDYKQMVLIDSSWFNIKVVCKGKFCVSAEWQTQCCWPLVQLRTSSSVLFCNFHFFLLYQISKFSNSVLYIILKLCLGVVV